MLVFLVFLAVVLVVTDLFIVLQQRQTITDLTTNIEVLETQLDTARTQLSYHRRASRTAAYELWSAAERAELADAVYDWENSQDFG